MCFSLLGVRKHGWFFLWAKVHTKRDLTPMMLLHPFTPAAHLPNQLIEWQVAFFGFRLFHVTTFVLVSEQPLNAVHYQYPNGE